MTAPSTPTADGLRAALALVDNQDGVINTEHDWANLRAVIAVARAEVAYQAARAALRDFGPDGLDEADAALNAAVADLVRLATGEGVADDR